MNLDSVKFSLGQKVYLAIDPEKVGMVTGIIFRTSGVSYYVTWAEDMNERPHCDVELSEEANFAEGKGE